MQIRKPEKRLVPLDAALRWQAGQFLFTRKYDGVFNPLETELSGHRVTLIAERMRPKSGGKFTATDRERNARFGTWFAAHSIAALDGQDLTRQPARERWRLLCELLNPSSRPSPRLGGEKVAVRKDPGFNGGKIGRPQGLFIADAGAGGEFVHACLAAGAEGVCAVAADDPWGVMHVVKPLLELKLRVTGKNHFTGALTLADLITGEPRGDCPAKAAFETVQIGDTVEVECLCLHESGKLREPRFRHGLH